MQGVRTTVISKSVPHNQSVRFSSGRRSFSFFCCEQTKVFVVKTQLKSGLNFRFCTLVMRIFPRNLANGTLLFECDMLAPWIRLRVNVLGYIVTVDLLTTHSWNRFESIYLGYHSLQGLLDRGGRLRGKKSNLDSINSNRSPTKRLYKSCLSFLSVKIGSSFLREGGK